MSNLKIWEAVRSVPQNATKPIEGGRLKGKTDINPMWRIKTLTEQFGPCGIGWKYVVTNKWTEKGFGDEVAAFVDIDMFIKVEGAWSEAIPGTGGSMLVAKEKNGPYTSDECFKMALTDAISVACKTLGFGADIYWQADRSKYDQIGGLPKQGTKPGQNMEKVPEKPKKEEADPGLVKLMKYASKQLGQETAKECLVNYLADKKHSAITDVKPSEYSDLETYINNYGLPDVLKDLPEGI